jgi:hypothetical protein
MDDNKQSTKYCVTWRADFAKAFFPFKIPYSFTVRAQMCFALTAARNVQPYLRPFS